VWGNTPKKIKVEKKPEEKEGEEGEDGIHLIILKL